jgi:argininosuccinate lyase
LTTFAPEFRADMVRLLQPKEGMRSRNLPGGTGPEAVRDAMSEAHRRLDNLRRHSP